MSGREGRDSGYYVCGRLPVCDRCEVCPLPVAVEDEWKLKLFETSEENT